MSAANGGECMSVDVAGMVVNGGAWVGWSSGGGCGFDFGAMREAYGKLVSLKRTWRVV